MKRPHPLIIFFVIMLIGAVWQVATLFMEHYPITNYPPRGTRIVSFGDSLMVGIGASAPEVGFIPLLAERAGTQIINKSISGNTTADGLMRLDADVISEEPDIVLLLLGGNDYLKQIPREETFANLRSIITKIQSTGAVVIVLGVRGGLLNDHFARDFKSLAEDTGALYVPNVLDGIFGVSELMSDQIHPNDRGYLKIVDKVAPSLMGLLGAVREQTPTESTR